MELCEKLKQARKKSGFTQDQVAEQLHISRQAVSQWETGKSYPDIENLRSLNTIYSLDLSTLLDCKSRESPYFTRIWHKFLVLLSLVGVLIIFLYFVNKDSLGYQWKCIDGDRYESKIHLLPDTAVDKANEHASRSGHRVSIFKR